MAKRKRRKAGRKKRSNPGLPGWVHMLFGLTVGLAVAAGIYVSDRRNSATVTRPEHSRPVRVEPAVPAAAEEPDEADIEFDFYDMLPALDVPVFDDPEAPPRRRPSAQQPPVEKAGIYILQAGSFSDLDDARRQKARIALLGIRAEVRKGEANGRTVYRVYTRPLDTPDKVNRTRQRLQEAGIESLAKRVSD